MRRPLTSYLRFCFVLVLVAGTLLPKMSAALVSLIPGAQTMVICTGAELITIVMAADGTPIEVKEGDTTPCTLLEAGDPVEKPMPYWVSLALSDIPRLVVRENAALMRDRLSILKPQRGPPVLV